MLRARSNACAREDRRPKIVFIAVDDLNDSLFQQIPET
jgi:hypothetical protein